MSFERQLQEPVTDASRRVEESRVAAKEFFGKERGMLLASLRDYFDLYFEKARLKEAIPKDEETGLPMYEIRSMWTPPFKSEEVSPGDLEDATSDDVFYLLLSGLDKEYDERSVDGPDGSVREEKYLAGHGYGGDGVRLQVKLKGMDEIEYEFEGSESRTLNQTIRSAFDRAVALAFKRNEYRVTAKGEKF